eukprot:scaffold2200_cov112-Cylindrotheca_fusiformis.AAC.8
MGYHNPKSYLKSRRLANSGKRRTKVIESVEHVMFNSMMKTDSTRARGDCPRDDETLTTCEPSSSNTLNTIGDGRLRNQDENCTNAKWVWENGETVDDDEVETCDPSSSNTLNTIGDSRLRNQDENCTDAKWVSENGETIDDGKVETCDPSSSNTLSTIGNSRLRSQDDDNEAETCKPSSSNTLNTIGDSRVRNQDEKCTSARWVWENGEIIDDDEDETWGSCIHTAEQSLK